MADDLSTFAGPEYFDETPLYSRYRQVDFLRSYGDFNALLIELSLDYLDRVMAAMRDDRITRFAAITIISDDDGKHLVPHIFVCSSEVQQRLAKLKLSSPSTDLGKQVIELARRARPDMLSVFEDRDTVPGETRVFMGYTDPPPGFAALEEFAVVGGET